MLKKIRLKFLFLVILTLLSIFLMLPSVVSNLPEWYTKYLWQQGFQLGLDLKGGTHLILQVDLDQVVQNNLNMQGQDIKDIAEKRGLDLQVGAAQKNSLPVNLAKADDQAAWGQVLKEEFPQLEIKDSSRQGEGMRVFPGFEPQVGHRTPG